MPAIVASACRPLKKTDGSLRVELRRFKSMQSAQAPAQFDLDEPMIEAKSSGRRGQIAVYRHRHTRGNGGPGGWSRRVQESCSVRRGSYGLQMFFPATDRLQRRAKSRTSAGGWASRVPQRKGRFSEPIRTTDNHTQARISWIGSTSSTPTSFLFSPSWK